MSETKRRLPSPKFTSTQLQWILAALGYVSHDLTRGECFAVDARIKDAMAKGWIVQHKRGLYQLSDDLCDELSKAPNRKP